MLNHAVSAEETELRMGPLQQSAIDAFAKATDSRYYTSIPPTFYTAFRTSEFQWIERLKVDLRNLLHTEQEYEYLAAMKIGHEVVIKTRLAEQRERRSRSGSLTVFVLESDIFCDQHLCVVARSTFVVRSAGKSE